jgi:hypothetical protein
MNLFHLRIECSTSLNTHGFKGDNFFKKTREKMCFLYYSYVAEVTTGREETKGTSHLLMLYRNLRDSAKVFFT